MARTGESVSGEAVLMSAFCTKELLSDECVAQLQQVVDSAPPLTESQERTIRSSITAARESESFPKAG